MKKRTTEKNVTRDFRVLEARELMSATGGFATPDGVALRRDFDPGILWAPPPTKPLNGPVLDHRPYQVVPNQVVPNQVPTHAPDEQ